MIVDRLPEEFSGRLSKFVATVRGLLGENLRSVILFGSAARGEFDTRDSDLNLLLVLEAVEYRHLTLLARHTRRWRRQRIATPLVLSSHYITGATDAFPLELLDMKAHHRVLFGEDVLQNIDPPRDVIRRQCEQEARGKLLHLREILMETSLKPRWLRQAMVLSVPSFLRMGRYILCLRGEPLPGRSQEVIDGLRQTTGLPLSGLEAAWHIKSGTLKPARARVAGLFEAYLNDVTALTRHVDEWIPE